MTGNDGKKPGRSAGKYEQVEHNLNSQTNME